MSFPLFIQISQRYEFYIANFAVYMYSEIGHAQIIETGFLKYVSFH